MSKAWTVESIERQSQRGGVNRQEVLFLIGKLDELRADLEDARRMSEAWRKAWFADTEALEDERDDLADAIIKHRNVHQETLDPQRRLEANRALWRLVEGDDGQKEEWHNGGQR